MAIKEMLPYRDDIIAMKQPPNVRTHQEVITYLEQTYNLKVSAPTVTRFLRLHAPHLVNSRNLTEDEDKTIQGKTIWQVCEVPKILNVWDYSGLPIEDHF